jgi:purine-binding chemotaxis protein CheW
MRPLPIVAIAGVPSFVCGVSLIRGEPTPVVDLGALLGANEPPSFTRFVTVRAGGRQVALAFEEVLHVQQISAESMAALPPLLQGTSEAAVSAVAVLDTDLLFVLDGARAVPDSVWPLLDERPQ